MPDYRALDPEKLEFISLAKVEELGEGERLVFNVDGLSIALFNIGGSYYAVDDVCTHDDGPLAEGDVDGCEIECPRHGARFDLATGKALTLPAVEDIAAYPVRVDGDQILVGLPLD